MSNEALGEVLNQLRDHGIEPFTKRSPGWVFGKLVRCKVEGDRNGEATGWYVLHEYTTASGKTLYFGRFGNWRQDLNEKFKLKGVRLTAEERELMHARQEEAKRKAAAKAAYAAQRAAQEPRGCGSGYRRKARRRISTASRSSGSAVATATAGVSWCPCGPSRGWWDCKSSTPRSSPIPAGTRRIGPMACRRKERSA